MNQECWRTWCLSCSTYLILLHRCSCMHICIYLYVCISSCVSDCISLRLLVDHEIYEILARKNSCPCFRPSDLYSRFNVDLSLCLMWSPSPDLLQLEGSPDEGQVHVSSVTGTQFGVHVVVSVPLELLNTLPPPVRDQGVIKFTPLFFNHGINEQQTIAYKCVDGNNGLDQGLSIINQKNILYC